MLRFAGGAARVGCRLGLPDRLYRVLAVHDHRPRGRGCCPVEPEEGQVRIRRACGGGPNTLYIRHVEEQRPRDVVEVRPYKSGGRVLGMDGACKQLGVWRVLLRGRSYGLACLGF